MDRFTSLFVNQRRNNGFQGLLRSVVPRFKTPIFILAAPRSGSTYLYELVRRMSYSYSFATENTPLWLRAFPPHEMSTKSEYISLEDCSDERLNNFKSLLALKIVFDRKNFRVKPILENFISRKPISCYVEKTISNCFHVEAINLLFPDAIFIHLVRDGRANVSSMIEGWDRFVNVNAVISKPASINHWSYPMPPEWHEQIEKPIEEICAWSWIMHNQCVLSSFKDRTNPNYLRIKYEDLRDNPMLVLKKISKHASIDISDTCLSYLNKNPNSKTTISSPKPEKWKSKNPKKINRVLESIEPMMSKLGYPIT
ncbi:sulfotransferase [Pleurocapsales cyanobacterium LEGE 06147]|nr:sulfotransferase [Pleurocapsales cyanobacterium LEGE 06147]